MKYIYINLLIGLVVIFLINCKKEAPVEDYIHQEKLEILNNNISDTIGNIVEIQFKLSLKDPSFTYSLGLDNDSICDDGSWWNCYIIFLDFSSYIYNYPFEIEGIPGENTKNFILAVKNDRSLNIVSYMHIDTAYFNYFAILPSNN